MVSDGNFMSNSFLVKEMDDFQDWAIFDIADVLKIYFRELPEPLLTVKLADTFLSIHQRELFHACYIFCIITIFTAHV